MKNDDIQSDEISSIELEQVQGGNSVLIIGDIIEEVLRDQAVAQADDGLSFGESFDYPKLRPFEAPF